jgi:hypothetical protein
LYLPPLISKIVYAVLLSSLLPKPSSSQLKASLFKDRSSYRRTASMVHLVESLVPGFANSSSSWIYRNSRFPWVPVETELIASGAGTAVFKVSWQGAEKVLRIYRRSLGKPRSGLLRVAAYYKNNYETMLSWYGSSPGLVLPIDFMVLEGPPLVGPVAASLQPYIRGQKCDLFEDFQDEELLALLKENDHLREQFFCFAEQTLLQWQEQKMCFDFLGRQNIMVVREGGKYNLRISDCGIFKLADLDRKYARIKTRVERRIDRLAFLCRRAKAITPGAHESPVLARH